jgi:hypothetical protein
MSQKHNPDSDLAGGANDDGAKLESNASNHPPLPEASIPDNHERSSDPGKQVQEHVPEGDYRKTIRDKNAAKVRRWRKKQKSKLEHEAEETEKVKKENEELKKEEQELTSRLSQLNHTIAQIERTRSQRALQQVSKLARREHYQRGLQIA